MTDVRDNAVVVRFLDSVCGHVRAQKLHHEIREELTVHLQERVMENVAQGMEEKEAIDSAIRCMGEPHRIGRDLDHAHRPKTDWVMLAFIVLFSGIGLLAMYNLQSSGIGSARYVNFFDNKLIHIMIGIVFMAILWSFDYEKIKKYSEYIFGFGVLLLEWIDQVALQMNGQSAWFVFGSLSFYVPTVSILLMLVGLSGIKLLREQSWKGTFWFLVYRGMVPIYLFMKMNVNTMAFLYLILFVFYLCLTKRYVWQIVAFAGSGALLMIYSIAGRDYMNSRALGFLNRTDDPQGSDYAITHTLDAMRSAGWWGKAAFPNNLPYAYSEGLLPGFIYYYGWAAGAVVLLLILGFIGKTTIASILIKDEYGKLLFASIGALFALQYIWAVAMTFGYAPFVGIPLPLLSYGGTDQIFHFAAIGLLLGIYRRRDMIPLLSGLKPKF